MSTPTQPLPGTEVRGEISRFVAQVERELDDLPRDDAAELTDGLEADLNEAWAVEGVRPGQRFGTPASYAAELRAAAGLPPRKRRGINGPAAMRLQWERDREELLGRLRAQPWWPQAVEYGRELRPAWWALRGAILVLLAAYVVGIAFVWMPAILIMSVPLVVWAAVASMRAGAADQAPTRRARGVLAAANVVTVGCLAVACIAALSSTNNAGRSYYYSDASSSEVPSSLTANGEAVSNVFAYDAAGRPITRFRLYDQAGRPLVTDVSVRDGYDDATGEQRVFKPDAGDAPPEWNLFPMLKFTQDAAGETDADGNDVVNQVEGPVAPPFLQVPALPASTAPIASAKPSPSASPSPSSPSPSASPSSPSPSASSSASTGGS